MQIVPIFSGGGTRLTAVSPALKFQPAPTPKCGAHGHTTTDRASQAVQTGQARQVNQDKSTKPANPAKHSKAKQSKKKPSREKELGTERWNTEDKR